MDAEKLGAFIAPPAVLYRRVPCAAGLRDMEESNGKIQRSDLCGGIGAAGYSCGAAGIFRPYRGSRHRPGAGVKKSSCKSKTDNYTELCMVYAAFKQRKINRRQVTFP